MLSSMTYAQEKLLPNDPMELKNMFIGIWSANDNINNINENWMLDIDEKFYIQKEAKTNTEDNEIVEYGEWSIKNGLLVLSINGKIIDGEKIKYKLPNNASFAIYILDSGYKLELIESSNYYEDEFLNILLSRKE